MDKKVQVDLRKLADRGKAEIYKRFFKTGKGEYGEGDVFLGITVPNIRLVVKKYHTRINLKEVTFLIRSKYHEERMAGFLILVEKFKSGDDLCKKKIYEFYVSNLRYINNWDLVDVTAPHIVGSYLYDKKRHLLYELASSNDLWKKRVAIISTLYFINQGDHKDTIKICKILLKDKHDLIHKAVGWMLREVGKKCSVKILEEFLKNNAARMPRTALRYSIEKFSEEKRLYWLRLKNFGL